MTKISMRNRIIKAMIEDKNAIPGRAGEMPISNLANAFEKLKDEEAREAIKAITNLVNTPPPLALADPEEFWTNLSFLSQYLKSDRNLIKEAFFARLFGSKALDARLRVRAFQGYLGNGGMLDEPQLMALWFLRDEAPVLWLGAAVSSGLILLAKKETLRLLTEGEISSRKGDTLILSLDSWKKFWPPDEDFFKVVEDFQNAAQDSETKEKLLKWIERRRKQS
ncbi:MAG: hypothetical protein Q8R12_00350 [bacterium]|nr:hypothetical protein [bacterium]